jgi:hypothetical protein
MPFSLSKAGKIKYIFETIQLRFFTNNTLIRIKILSEFICEKVKLDG